MCSCDIMITVEEAKKNAAYAAVDACTDETTSVIGIGSGSTVPYCVERLSQLVRKGKISIVACIPTSYQSRDEIIKHGLPLGDLLQHPNVDVLFDGADQVDDGLQCIKGAGGCFLQEKIVAIASKKVIIVVHESKRVAELGEFPIKVPIEIVPNARTLLERIVIKFTPKIRESFGKMGPVITDGGNMILDLELSSKDDVREMADLVKHPGILETGLYLNLADQVFVGSRLGHVVLMTSNKVDDPREKKEKEQQC